MSSGSPEEDDGRGGGIDVLSDAEEKALSAVRDLVGGIRARGEPADIGAIATALSAAGGRCEDGAGSDPGSRAFRLKGARFSLREHPGGGVEINFERSTQ